MNLSGWFLLILALLVLGVLALGFLLVLQLTKMTERSSETLSQNQSQAMEALQDLSAASQQLLLSAMENLTYRSQMSSNESSTQHLSMTVGIFNKAMDHQELLINRMLAKDAVAVQAMDARQWATSNQNSSEEYIPQDDQSEAKRHENLTRPWAEGASSDYQEFLDDNDIQDDIEVSGLPIN